MGKISRAFAAMHEWALRSKTPLASEEKQNVGMTVYDTGTVGVGSSGRVGSSESSRMSRVDIQLLL